MRCHDLLLRFHSSLHLKHNVVVVFQLQSDKRQRLGRRRRRCLRLIAARHVFVVGGIARSVLFGSRIRWFRRRRRRCSRCSRRRNVFTARGPQFLQVPEALDLFAVVAHHAPPRPAVAETQFVGKNLRQHNESLLSLPLAGPPPVRFDAIGLEQVPALLEVPHAQKGGQQDQRSENHVVGHVVHVFPPRDDGLDVLEMVGIADDVPAVPVHGKGDGFALFLDAHQVGVLDQFVSPEHHLSIVGDLAVVDLGENVARLQSQSQSQSRRRFRVVFVMVFVFVVALVGGWSRVVRDAGDQDPVDGIRDPVRQPQGMVLQRVPSVRDCSGQLVGAPLSVHASQE
mmetsp:Transcript_3694/g.10459  ORF Transcript_3694/g.10459 Transcript_3694/m.10459 type:complete len:340 (+) Transcript_3694:664-1683(+)